MLSPAASTFSPLFLSYHLYPQSRLPPNAFSCFSTLHSLTLYRSRSCRAAIDIQALPILPHKSRFHLHQPNHTPFSLCHALRTIAVMPSPSFSQNLNRNHRLSPSPTPSQPILLVPSDDEEVPPSRLRGSSTRRSNSRWSGVLRFFQFPRRHRTNSSGPSRANPFHSTSPSHVSSPVSIRPSFSSSHRHNSSAAPSLRMIEMRRARRIRDRILASNSGAISSSSAVGGERNRRTMSDGALRQAAINSPASSSTSVTSSSQRLDSPSPLSRSALNSSRTIFTPTSAAARFRRPPNANGDGASTTSIVGITSAASGMSDSDDSNAHEDVLHRLHSGGSGPGSGAASVASEGRETRTSTLVSSALADLDAMQEHDLFAVVNRIFEDYPVPPSDAFQSSAVYLSRHPAHTPHRLAMRVRNTYYTSDRQHRRGYNGSLEGTLRIGMNGTHHHNHHHHPEAHGTMLHSHSGIHGALRGVFGVDDRDIRVHTFQPAHLQGGGHGAPDGVASDAQIEALPTFVMEKDETRSVKEIFESMWCEEENQKQEKQEKDEENMKEKHTRTTREQTDKRIGSEIEEKIDSNVDGKTEDDGALETDYTECAICLCDFEPGDEITALPCGHFFHLTGCVREWLSKHSCTCPTCRGSICDTSSGLGSAPRIPRRSRHLQSVPSPVTTLDDAA